MEVSGGGDTSRPRSDTAQYDFDSSLPPLDFNSQDPQAPINTTTSRVPINSTLRSTGWMAEDAKEQYSSSLSQIIKNS